MYIELISYLIRQVIIKPQKKLEAYEETGESHIKISYILYLKLARWYFGSNCPCLKY